MKALKRILVSLIAVAGTVNTLFYGGILGNESAIQVDTPSVLQQEEATPIMTDGGDTHSQEDTPTNIPSDAASETPATPSPTTSEVTLTHSQEDTPTNIPSDTASETTAAPSPTTPEVTPANTPTNNEAYRILEIDGTTSNNNFIYHTAYNSKEDVLYYFSNDNRTVSAYDLDSNTSSVVMTPEKLKAAILGEVEASISNTVDSRNISILGMAYNQYSDEIYIYGVSSEGFWLYSITENSTVENRFYNITWARLSFIDVNKYLMISDTNASIRDFEGDVIRSNLGSDIDYIFEHNEFFYLVSYSKIYKIGSVHSPNTEKIADLTGISGVSYRDNYLYVLLNDGIVYKIDIDNNSREPYILPTDITQTGRSFLGKLTGLIMTNDGGFITYDSSDKKLKYVVPN